MALLVVRHGEREDYIDPRAYYASEWGSARPWDPKLTEKGKQQGRALGRRVKEELQQRGLPPVTRVLTSPFVRCVETAHAANEALGVGELLVEEGVVEALCEKWFRTWAVPGANAMWGGPPGCSMGTPVPVSDVHPLAREGPAGVWLSSAAEIHDTVAPVCQKYESVYPLRDKPICWDRPECLASESPARCTEAARRIHLQFPNESVLVVSHGGPNQFIYCGLTKDPVEPPLSFASLTLLLPKKHVPESDEITWEAPIVACSKHLAES